MSIYQSTALVFYFGVYVRHCAAPFLFWDFILFYFILFFFYGNLKSPAEKQGTSQAILCNLT